MLRYRSHPASPFPEAWVYGQLCVLKDLRRLTFLLGETSIDGFWLLLPVALAEARPFRHLFSSSALGVGF